MSFEVALGPMSYRANKYSNREIENIRCRHLSLYRNFSEKGGSSNYLDILKMASLEFTYSKNVS